MTKFEKETNHRLYVFIRNNSVKCTTTVRAFDTYCLITQAWCLRSIGKLVAIRETSFLKKKPLFESFITSSALNQYLRWKVEVRDIFFSSARSRLTKTKIFLPINEKKNTKINRYSKIENSHNNCTLSYKFHSWSYP